MTDTPHDEILAARLKADADLAAAKLDEQYRAGLCRLVEREMDRRLRRKEDPEDVVQSVFRTFYRRNALGEFRVDSSADLWCLLATITRHKMLKHVEKFGAGKRDPKREEYLDGDVLRGRDPTPEEVAIAADLMEESLEGLDETYAEVLNLRLQNCTEEEIAAALGCTRGRVRTRMQRIRENLKKLSDDDGKPADLGDLLRRCLSAPVSGYLQRQPEEFAADSPSEYADLAMPLGELFQRADPPLGLLIAVKRLARRLMNARAGDCGMDLRVRPTVEVDRLIYFACIAAALVRHGRQISKSSPEVLRVAWEQLAAESYPEEGLRKLFAAAQERIFSKSPRPPAEG